MSSHVWSGIATLVVLALLPTVGGCGRVKPHERPPAPPALASQVTSPSPIPLAGKVEADSKRTYIGVFKPDAPFDTTSLDSYSDVSDRTPAIVMWYQPWAVGMANRFDGAACASVIQRGAVPLITWEPWSPSPGGPSDAANQPDFALSSINTGRYDGYIRSWAKQIKAFGGPVMLRPLHEMNGNWYPWSGMANGNKPEEYVVAWRHIHDIFAEEGAANVTWVWSINWNSVPIGSRNAYEVYYPGDEYVDWTAISGFNWGTSRPKYQWMTFDQIYHEPLAYLETKRKPIMLAEIATARSASCSSPSHSSTRTGSPSPNSLHSFFSNSFGLPAMT